ncbi:hypothetical protein [Kitasatospora sp. GP82]|uniref:hypothetical protein n=1 Tax=Kitasatospora sp. GP82 TaxID=3035089 RepID=UPI002473F92B|nr:hypothetical protein [Kitasatospora sp. GP82]
MNDPEQACRPSSSRTDWALVHPLLTALSQAGVPIRSGDLDQLQHAAHLGPDFVHAFTRWIREAQTATAAAVIPTAPPLPARPAAPSPSAELHVLARPHRGRERQAS